ncbi:hypothetical protein ACA910_016151 [Epithemia clementina (nom. ined.)]
MTHWLGAWLQNYLHNSGGFCTLVDGLVAMTAAPVVPVTAPSAAWIFVQHSFCLQQITYGKHLLQYMQLLLSKDLHQQIIYSFTVIVSAQHSFNMQQNTKA